MKVKDLIELVTNNQFYSIDSVDEYLMDNYDEVLKPLYRTDDSVQHLIDVVLHDEAYFVSATILYQCDDGVVGINGLYYNFIESVDDKDCEYVCTAKEYVLENKLTWVEV